MSKPLPMLEHLSRARGYHVRASSRIAHGFRAYGYLTPDVAERLFHLLRLAESEARREARNRRFLCHAMLNDSRMNLKGVLREFIQKGHDAPIYGEDR